MIKTSTLLILAAIVAVIYVVHQAQTTVQGVASAKSGAVTTIVQGATGALSSFFNFLSSGRASGGNKTTTSSGSGIVGSNVHGSITYGDSSGGGDIDPTSIMDPDGLIPPDLESV